VKRLPTLAIPKAAPVVRVDERKATRFERTDDTGRVPGASRLRRESLGDRVTVYLPPELAEGLRVRCARERRSVSDAVTEAVFAWMKAQGHV
jgi:hypothetical protein